MVGLGGAVQPSQWLWAQASLLSPHAQVQRNQPCWIQDTAVEKPSSSGNLLLEKRRGRNQGTWDGL